MRNFDFKIVTGNRNKQWNVVNSLIELSSYTCMQYVLSDNHILSDNHVPL